MKTGTIFSRGKSEPARDIILFKILNNEIGDLVPIKRDKERCGACVRLNSGGKWAESDCEGLACLLRLSGGSNVVMNLEMVKAFIEF